MTTDRVGGVIYNAIKGETVNYNGADFLFKGVADLKVTYDEKSDTTPIVRLSGMMLRFQTDI
jgi:peptide/nickel transport system substrate-binding protein